VARQSQEEHDQARLRGGARRAVVSHAQGCGAGGVRDQLRGPATGAPLRNLRTSTARAASASVASSGSSGLKAFDANFTNKAAARFRAAAGRDDFVVAYGDGSFPLSMKGMDGGGSAHKRLMTRNENYVLISRSGAHRPEERVPYHEGLPFVPLPGRKDGSWVGLRPTRRRSATRLRSTRTAWCGGSGFTGCRSAAAANGCGRGTMRQA